MKKDEERELLELLRKQELRAQSQADTWEDIKKWVGYIIIGIVAFLFIKAAFTPSDENWEDAPEYCDVAICK